VKLYLDDYRTPPKGDGYASADNYADFLALLDKYRDCLETVDLDYDLGWDSLFNGYNALTYMKKYGMKPKHINVHSTHVSGREKMLRYAVANFPDALVTGWPSDY
jgi:hypothetical protein